MRYVKTKFKKCQECDGSGSNAERTGLCKKCDGSGLEPKSKEKS